MSDPNADVDKAEERRMRRAEVIDGICKSIVVVLIVYGIMSYLTDILTF